MRCEYTKSKVIFWIEFYWWITAVYLVLGCWRHTFLINHSKNYWCCMFKKLLPKEEKYFEGILWTLNDIDKVLAKDPTIISELNTKDPDYTIFIFLFFFIIIISSSSLKWLYKQKQFKKIFIISIIWYIITLPIVIFLSWLLAIIINIFVWFFGIIFWIFSGNNQSWNFWWSGFGGGWRWGWGWFGWGSFGWGGSSGKW